MLEGPGLEQKPLPAATYGHRHVRGGVKTRDGWRSMAECTSSYAPVWANCFAGDVASALRRVRREPLRSSELTDGKVREVPGVQAARTSWPRTRPGRQEAPPRVAPLAAARDEAAAAQLE